MMIFSKVRVSPSQFFRYLTRLRVRQKNPYLYLDTHLDIGASKYVLSLNPSPEEPSRTFTSDQGTYWRYWSCVWSLQDFANLFCLTLSINWAWIKFWPGSSWIHGGPNQKLEKHVIRSGEYMIHSSININAPRPLGLHISGAGRHFFRKTKHALQVHEACNYWNFLDSCWSQEGVVLLLEPYLRRAVSSTVV
jgi:hypothetical protein